MMYGADVYKGIENDLLVPDPNEILNLKYLKPIGEIIKSNGKNIDTNKLDDEDISNLLNWYESYKIIYSYPEKEHKLSKKWEGIFNKINNNKGREDLMGLVEIAIGRLLQAEFEKRDYDVRIRKTTNFDDITSGIDYIVEFNDKKGNIKNVIGIDFTISEKGADSLIKNFKKKSYPDDYKNYFEKKNGKKMKSIPRIVIKLSRDLAYSFTNNFFITVLEKGSLLDSDDIFENFGYAVEDVRGLNIGSYHFEISHILEDTKSNVSKLLNKF